VTLWYDLTTASTARGPNGIANTERLIALELLNLGVDVQFFRLQDGVLARCDRSALPDFSPPSATVAPINPEDRPLRAALRHAVLRRVLATPQQIAALRQHRTRLSDRLRQSVSRVLRPLRARRHQQIKPHVNADDVVVSLGADWSGALLGHLSALRAVTGCRLVTMAFDLIPLTHTHLAFHKDPPLFERYFRSVLTSSDVVTCISESTRRELLSFARRSSVDAPPTTVLQLGDSSAPPAAQFGRRDGSLFLWVGTIERRKNLDVLVDALHIMNGRGVTLPTVVVAGEQGWGVNDLMGELRLRSNAVSRSISLVGAIDDSQLDRLYRSARCLVFPSHTEGWGLPLREAAVRGCPVLCGDHPAAREALGDWAGSTFLPTGDPVAWADAMTQTMTESAAERPEIEARLWRDAAADLAQLCHLRLDTAR
jgi:glycosyltransferase involved in cell wall biosynthesis